jgi:hypothetical protein
MLPPLLQPQSSDTTSGEAVCRVFLRTAAARPNQVIPLPMYMQMRARRPTRWHPRHRRPLERLQRTSSWQRVGYLHPPPQLQSVAAEGYLRPECHHQSGYDQAAQPALCTCNRFNYTMLRLCTGIRYMFASFRIRRLGCPAICCKQWDERKRHFGGCENNAGLSPRRPSAPTGASPRPPPCPLHLRMSVPPLSTTLRALLCQWVST